MVTVIGCVVIVLFVTFAVCDEFQMRPFIVALILALMLGLFLSGIIRQIAIAENTSHYTTHSKPKKLISLNSQKKIDLEYKEEKFYLFCYEDEGNLNTKIIENQNVETKRSKKVTTPVLVEKYYVRTTKQPDDKWYPWIIIPSERNNYSKDTLETSYILKLPK